MFGRKKQADGDLFKVMGEARRVAEDEQPWFLGEDDGPALDVEAGRSARMDETDSDLGG